MEIEETELYAPFRVAASLGSPLPAPVSSFLYVVITVDEYGNLTFLGCYNSEDKAESAIAKVVLDELEMLDADAPWMSITDSQRAGMNLKDYVALYTQKRDAWVSRKSNKEIIEEFYGKYLAIKKMELE
jgi:hypothetical protein